MVSILCETCLLMVGLKPHQLFDTQRSIIDTKAIMFL